jgi:hypothetical protein
MLPYPFTLVVDPAFRTSLPWRPLPLRQSITRRRGSRIGGGGRLSPLLPWSGRSLDSTPPDKFRRPWSFKCPLGRRTCCVTHRCTRSNHLGELPARRPPWRAPRRASAGWLPSAMGGAPAAPLSRRQSVDTCLLGGATRSSSSACSASGFSLRGLPQPHACPAAVLGAARWAACLHAFEQNSRGRRRAATALFPHRLQYTSSRCVRLHARDSLRFAVIFALDFLRPAAWHSGEHVRAAQ